MSARHRWALFEMRFDWLRGRVEGRILSTHKTWSAAKRRRDTAAKGLRTSIIRSRDVNAVERVGQWWPA
jgi:hypothetical protein